MLGANLVILVCLAYVAMLFAVAFAGDRRARRDPGGWLASPLVYTLSISIYCSSWTFFGAVGSATRSGLEYATIYIGPMIVFIGWRLFLHKLVTVGRVHHTTSIADFISARFGKSPALGALVTIIAVVATAPYIALQLKALTDGFHVLTSTSAGAATGEGAIEPDYVVAFWVAAGLCAFSIMFGVRNIDVNERHQGVIAAIAVEAVVKLAALMAVGIWVIVGAGSLSAAFANAPEHLVDASDIFGTRWVTLCFLSAAAVICLPRQFQVTVVENSSESQLRTASWLFPLYLLLITLFVLPVAIAGSNLLPEGASPDLYVLSLPLAAKQNAIALLALLGGFSSGTSMVIVCSIALSTMISNHIVMPLALRLSIVPVASTGMMRHFILGVRRASVVFVVFLGFIYFSLGDDSDALASIGLIAFCGLAQFLPSIVGGLFWRRATHAGAIAGMVAGILIWSYTLFLPGFQGAPMMSADIMTHGPFGLAWLRPHTLFGLSGADPLVHAVFWSLSINTALFIGISMLTEPTPLGRIQSTLFVDVFSRQAESELRLIRRKVRVADLRGVAARVLGDREAAALIDREATGEQSVVASDELISLVERRLAASIGAASARALVSRVVTSETISVEELKRLAGEADQIRAYSAELERKSHEIEATARELARANEQLRAMDAKKDEFLSQVSHEVRTPMSSIRSFSDILLSTPDLAPDERDRFLGIVHTESLRLTRLLDGILDLNQMEHGEPAWPFEIFDPEEAVDQALESCEALAHTAGVVVQRPHRAHRASVEANRDKLAQIVINLVSNAIKYNTGPAPLVSVSTVARDGVFEIRVEDNGPGIPESDRTDIFDKFVRGKGSGGGGAGLGLAISRSIAERLGGELRLLPSRGSGAEFLVRIPLCAETRRNADA